MYIYLYIYNSIYIDIGFDHHCPWVTKCVGKNNCLFFYSFIGNTVILIGYFVISAAAFV